MQPILPYLKRFPPPIVLPCTHDADESNQVHELVNPNDETEYHNTIPNHAETSRLFVVVNLIAGLQITRHALKRLAQRQITAQMVADTIKHGQKVCKQGLCFYVMTQRLAQQYYQPPYANRIVNTVVVTKRPDILLTAYKNSKALRSIQKKPKRLLR